MSGPQYTQKSCNVHCLTCFCLFYNLWRGLTRFLPACAHFWRSPCHLSHLPGIYSSQSCWDRQLCVQGCSTWELWWNQLRAPAPDPGGCPDSEAGTGQMENYPLSTFLIVVLTQQIKTSDQHNYCCLLCSLGRKKKKKKSQLLISTWVGTSSGWQISRLGQVKDLSPCLTLKTSA